MCSAFRKWFTEHSCHQQQWSRDWTNAFRGNLNLSDNRGGKCPVIHLTVSALMRTPPRLLDLVNHHDCAHTHGGTCSHTATLRQGRAGQNVRPCQQAAGTSTDITDWSPLWAGLEGGMGTVQPARTNLSELVASQSLFSRWNLIKALCGIYTEPSESCGLSCSPGSDRLRPLSPLLA